MSWAICRIMLIFVALQLPATLPATRPGRLSPNPFGPQSGPGWQEILDGVAAYNAQDFSTAMSSFRRAMEKGDRRGEMWIGTIYERGAGVPRNFYEAVNWYRRSQDTAEDAVRFLESSYRVGMIALPWVEKMSAEDAVTRTRAFAEAGAASAQFDLGVRYQYGRGVSRSDEDAMKWYVKAAEQRYADAEFALGAMYDSGRGVPKSDEEALNWYRKAADQDYADAQFNLGVMYANGQGVMRSGSAAVDWYYKAAQNYLTDGEREDALLCYDRMKAIAPDNFLVTALFRKIYGEPTERDPPRNTATSGTAWPIAEGYVVTNNHVVSGASKITLVCANGAKIIASVAARDAANDIALLKVTDPSQLPPALPLATGAIAPGDRVFTIGYPHPDIMGDKPKLSDGIVSDTTGIGDDPRTIQVGVALQAGNSGGPMLNDKGEVVGIALAKLNAVTVFKWTGDLPENVAYAVKVAYLKPLIDSVPKAAKPIAVLPARKAPLPDLAARIQDSVLMVICE